MKLGTIKLCVLASMIGAFGVGRSIHAAPVTVPNYSFESPVLAPGGVSQALALLDINEIRTNEYWFGAGNGGNNIYNVVGTTNLFTLTDSGDLPPPADGVNFVLIGTHGYNGYVWQDLGALQSNTVYTLTIAYGQPLPGTNGVNNTGTGQIALVNGADPFEPYLAATQIDTSILTPGTFGDATVSLTTGNQVSGDLTILMLGTGGNELAFDNVRLDATPTPNSPTALLPEASPTNQVFQGQKVTLSENSAGQPPFTYQWLSDNGTGGATFSTVAGATGASYVADTSAYSSGSSVEYEVVVQNSFGSSTSAPVTLTILPGQAPSLVTDTSPQDGNGNGSSEPVGGSVTFSAQFVGSFPLTYQWEFEDTNGNLSDIPGATNTTLTITDLQPANTGFYYLQAANSLGTAQSTMELFRVSEPIETNGVVISTANQFGYGGLTVFSPTWVLAGGSLIAGEAPSSYDTSDSFSIAGAGGTPVLTDGKFGIIWPAGTASSSLASCGNNNSGAGTYVVYTLPASANGYDLTNITVYGGWSDSGRDEQSYNVYYSTVADPTNFNVLLGTVQYDPTTSITPEDQSATRVTITSANTNGIVAYNAAAIKFDFTPATENGWCGYAELQVFGKPGTAAIAPPLVTQPPFPSYAADVVGSQETFTAGFSGAQISYQWLVDTGSGPVPVPGATNSTLTITNLQLSDAGSYSLQASNSAGVVVSPSPAILAVNPAPTADANGILVGTAVQGGVSTLPPTWKLSDSLITGIAPSTAIGNFTPNQNSVGVRVLTDGQVGSQDNGSLANMAGCGVSYGNSVTYTLPGSASGYDLTNIVVYGGWQDGGRDSQVYTIYYSTVTDPTNFVELDSVNYNPSGVPAGARDTRVSLVTADGAALATNVFAVKFDFTMPAGQENNWQGYAELQLFGSPSASVPIPAPVLTSDTVPALASDVVGSSVTFKAAFNSTVSPITYQWQKDGTNIPGATSSTLTISNLQLSDSGSYNLVASNVNGSASSTTNTFVVNPDPSPANGVTISPAVQGTTGLGFMPTWTVADSLITGQSPSSVGSGNFGTYGTGGTAALTDGVIAGVGAGTWGFAAGGNNGDNPGHSVTYTLMGSASGYDVTKLVNYGGWADGGRNQQAYTVSFSTVDDPTNFTHSIIVNYSPTVPGIGGSFSQANVSRVTVTSASGGSLATNVAAVKFDFTTPLGENGWEGYAELGVFGTPSVAGGMSITFNPVQVLNGNLVLTGTGGSPDGTYTWLTSTNVATPLADWTSYGTGVFDSEGAFSNSIPILKSEPTRFFRLKTP